MHAVWKKCPTVDIMDVATLKNLIRRTYGTFGVTRSKSDCFRVNVYVGKKNADYVRPSPRMSKLATLMSEYYRQHFNPTLHPIVYKMVNSLTTQALDFQKGVDPVYD